MAINYGFALIYHLIFNKKRKFYSYLTSNLEVKQIEKSDSILIKSLDKKVEINKKIND